MKLKKCLLTSLSLGLSAITIGAVVSSCASPAAEATDPNPASANSISTNPGDPLTPEQQDYQQKLAAEIKVQFDANASLDYSNPTDKAKIDNQITEYENNLASGNLKDLINQIKGLDQTATSYIDLSNLFSSFYDSFKQKNLIPTEDTINNYYIKNPPPSGITNWKQLAGVLAVFYSDPKDIILLAQCALKVGKNSTILNNDVLIQVLVIPSIPNKIFLSLEGPDHEAYAFYQTLIEELKPSSKIDA